MLLHPRSEADAHPTGPVEVTVIIRWIPLVTAACGTRVARPARTRMLAPGNDGSQLGRMDLSLVTTASRASREGGAAASSAPAASSRDRGLPRF